MKDQLLELDVRLLVLRYGMDRLKTVLAALDEQTFEQVELQIQLLARKPKTNKTKISKLSLLDIAATASSENTIMEKLKILATRFENRTFLKDLRDVKRFLAQNNQPLRSLKSREAAGPVLIRALAKLPPDELERLVKTDGPTLESDYSLLSRAIMKSNPGDQEEESEEPRFGAKGS